MTFTLDRQGADLDQHYLRSRGNRRVRKARRLRGLLRSWSLVAVNALALALLFYAGKQAYRYATTTDALALATFQVEGASRVSPDSIRERLAGLRGRNLLSIDLDEAAARAREEPWVSSTSVKRILPRTLRVTLTEREPVALAAHPSEGVVAVDATGRAIVPVGPEFAEILPVITGLDRLREPELGARLLAGARAAERLRERSAAWIAEISELDMADGDRIRVVTVSPGPAILLDPVEVERNLAPYLSLRGEIDATVGPVEYVDLRWRDRITVLPGTDARKGSD